MSYNSFGHIFRVTTWGESHGPAIGCVIDGVPSRLSIDETEIQHYLDQRKPGQNRFMTQRQEADEVKILSGVFEGMTTGTPLSLMIENTDQRSKDYGDIKDKYRPGHADFTYMTKYGIRDHRGGGRSSARETACRVAAGAIARKILREILGADITVKAALIQIGDQKINRDNWDWDAVDDNPFWCPDREMVPIWEKYLDNIRKKGSSIGAVIEVRATGLPPGIGAPVYAKLDSDLALAMMSINAVKAVEIGEGFNAACLTGEENADEMYRDENGAPAFRSNHAGGILGGISTGQEIVCRFAVKPTSSILTPRKTVDIDIKDTEIITKGRHDPCVGIRAVPIGAAMMACVLADHLLLHRAQQG